jgi:hypothetical protein
MQVQKCGYTQSFKANFGRNKSFMNVVKYAKDNNYLMTLDGALNSIKKSNAGTINLIDGYTPAGKIYSTFMFGKHSVSNAVSDASSPAEASFDAIIELGLIGGKKSRELFGKNPEQNVTIDSILREYTI